MVRTPLVTLSADGQIFCVELCAEPDRMAATSFYAGVLIPASLVDSLSALCRQQPVPTTLLPELLAAAAADFTPELCDVAPGHRCGLAVVSGLDYDTLRLTPQTRVRVLVEIKN